MVPEKTYSSRNQLSIMDEDSGNVVPPQKLGGSILIGNSGPSVISQHCNRDWRLFLRQPHLRCIVYSPFQPPRGEILRRSDLRLTAMSRHSLGTSRFTSQNGFIRFPLSDHAHQPRQSRLGLCFGSSFWLLGPTCQKFRESWCSGQAQVSFSFPGSDHSRVYRLCNGT